MYSNGSRQRVQRYKALQAVALNADVCSVASDPQDGHPTRRTGALSVSGIGPV
jgi:hypothetical protein